MYYLFTYAVLLLKFGLMPSCPTPFSLLLYCLSWFVSVFFSGLFVYYHLVIKNIVSTILSTSIWSTPFCQLPFGLTDISSIAIWSINIWCKCMVWFNTLLLIEKLSITIWYNAISSSVIETISNRSSRVLSNTILPPFKLKMISPAS